MCNQTNNFSKDFIYSTNINQEETNIRDTSNPPNESNPPDESNSFDGLNLQDGSNISEEFNNPNNIRGCNTKVRTIVMFVFFMSTIVFISIIFMFETMTR